MEFEDSNFMQFFEDSFSWEFDFFLDLEKRENIISEWLDDHSYFY
jgi:hypothetical protein